MSVRALVIIAAATAACSSPPGPNAPSAESTPRLPPERAPAGPAPTAPPPSPYSEASMRADIDWLCDADRQGRGSYQAGGKATAAWLQEKLRELGYQIRTQKVGNQAVSVFAIKPGGPQAVIVSAHYDHLGVDAAGKVYPGADDNASGVAVMLAMARAARDLSFEHTVIFASFGGEEDRLKGSGVYVKDPIWPLAKTRAVINFDMVGRNFYETGSGKKATAAIVGLELDPEARKVADARAREVGLTLIRASAGLVELFGYAGRTDEWWFRRYGVKAVHFSTGLHPDYHQPTDTPDKLEYGQMNRVARTASALLDHFAGRAAARPRNSSGGCCE